MSEFSLSPSKASEWRYFFKKLGYVIDPSTEIDEFFIKKVLPEISMQLMEIPELQKHFALLQREYCLDYYSIDVSRKLLFEVIEKKRSDYPIHNIPIYYCTIPFPTGFRFPPLLWKEFCSNASFRDRDFGHVDLAGTIISLVKEELIPSPYFYEILHASNSLIVYKVSIDATNLVKNKTYKKTIEDIDSKVKQTTTSKELLFDIQTGEIVFGESRATALPGTKDRAFLDLLFRDPNTPFTLNDIKRFCNENIQNNVHKFKTKKNVYDTLRQIKQKLKVSTSEIFPIRKEVSEKLGDVWILYRK